jgi:tetratricopeptide (TPR) repeat protein
MHVMNRDYAAAEQIVQELLRDEDRNLRRIARLMRANIMLHQGRLTEYLKRKELARQTTELEYGSDLREMSQYYQKFYDFLRIEELTDDPQWLDSATTQFNLYSGAFMQETAIVRSDSLSNLRAANRIALRSGDTTAIRAALSELCVRLDTSVASERRLHGLAMFRFHHDQENYDSALVHISRFISSDNSTSIATWRGRLFFLAGRYGEAVEQLERAQKRFDSDRYYVPVLSIRLHYWLGRCYEESGWTDKAIAQFEIFTDIWKDADPGITDLEDARARLASLKPRS